MVDSANDPMDIFNLWRMSAFMFLGVSVQPETWSDWFSQCTSTL